jgi:hypothetical protein
MRWDYGGRWRSCDSEEGGEGELDAPRTKNGERRARATLTVDEARDGVGRPDSGGIWTRRRHGFRQRRRLGRDGARRGGLDSGGGAVGTARGRNGATLSGCRRAVPTAHLMCGCGAWQPRGNGALPGGPGADSGDPLVSVFRIKITPDENRSK